MSKIIAPCLLLLAMQAISTPAKADICVSGPQSDITRIYFANGMLTEPAAANLALIAIHKAYNDRLASSNDHRYQFLNAYSSSPQQLTAVLAALELGQQQLGIVDPGLISYQVYQWLQAGLSAAEIANIVRVSIRIRDKETLISKLTPTAISELNQRLFSATAEQLQPTDVSGEHANYYESDLLAGKRVIVLAHSQGNLFTNAALAIVLQRQPDLNASIATIGVATPAVANVGDNIHITAHDDNILDALRQTTSITASNLTNTPDQNDFRSTSRHAFQRDYFDSRLRSRGQIDTEIQRLAQVLPYPQLVSGDGAIRANLSWQTAPSSLISRDLDLHVYEPYGAHLYYASPQGQTGYLQSDSSGSRGLESYLVTCQDIALGSYRFAVNFFSGLGPVIARLSLQLGDGRTVSVENLLLLQAQGAAGNNNVQPLATLDVSRDAVGKISYTLR